MAGSFYISCVCLPLTSLQEPEGPPNPEQTASPLSFVTYAFLDKFLWEASRMAHCPFEKLPPLADYDRTDYLVERSFEVRIR